MEAKIVKEDAVLKYGNLKRFYRQKLDEDRELQKREEQEKRASRARESGARAKGLSEENEERKQGAGRTDVPSEAFRARRTKERDAVAPVPRKGSIFQDYKALNQRESRVSQLVHAFKDRVTRLTNSKRISQAHANPGSEQKASLHSSQELDSSPRPEAKRPRVLLTDRLSLARADKCFDSVRVLQKSKSTSKLLRLKLKRQRELRSQSVRRLKPNFEDTVSRLQFLVRFFLHETGQTDSLAFSRRLLEEKKACDAVLAKLEKERQFKLPFLKRVVKNVVFKRPWSSKLDGIKAKSFFKDFKSYCLKPVILKGGDDLRQEVFAMQLFKKFHAVFAEEQTGLYLRPYEIMVTSSTAGFLEFLNDTVTVSSLKKKFDLECSLVEIYRSVFGLKFEFARKNFVESLAGYSLLCYLLQIKDRHNGNIMVTHEGHLVHIDFGFLLSNSPGNVSFETAPFKVTADYVGMMDGPGSDYFEYFENLLVKGLVAINRHFDEVVALVKATSEKSPLPCFRHFSLDEFKQRFRNQHMAGPDPEKAVGSSVHQGGEGAGLPKRGLENHKVVRRVPENHKRH